MPADGAEKAQTSSAFKSPAPPGRSRGIPRPVGMYFPPRCDQGLLPDGLADPLTSQLGPFNIKELGMLGFAVKFYQSLQQPLSIGL